MLTLKSFIDTYAEMNNITKKQSREEIERFIETYKTVTIENGGINLVGFAKSEVVTIPSKTVKNPKTKEDVVVPERQAVKLKISRKFKYMEDEVE